MSTLCTKCGLACDEDEYRVHMLNDCQTIKCPKCPQHYANTAALLRHTRAAHDKEFVCSLCQMVFASKYNLKRHLAFTHKQINNKKTIECEQCGEIFVTKHYLKRHIQGVHNKEFVCTVCEKEFDKIYSFKKHMQRVHKEAKVVIASRVECPKCNKLIAKSLLERHIRIKHSKGLEKVVFSCHVCERECPSEKALHKHIEARHPEENSEEALLKKKFKCPLCPQRFSSNWTVKMHVKGKHEQQFKCEICEQFFSAPFPLIRHKSKIHGVEIDYETVMKNQSLNKEEAFPKKKFKCPQCPQRFSYSWGVKQHIKGKHELQYQCEICNKFFSAQFPLERHKLNVHKINSDNETIQIKTEVSKNGFVQNIENYE